MIIKQLNMHIHTLQRQRGHSALWSSTQRAVISRRSTGGTHHARFTGHHSPQTQAQPKKGLLRYGPHFCVAARRESRCFAQEDIWKHSSESNALPSTRFPPEVLSDTEGW